MKILCKVVDDVFRKNPKAVKDAQTIKSARQYLTDLVVKELDGVSKLHLESIFSTVKEKLDEMAEKT